MRYIHFDPRAVERARRQSIRHGITFKTADDLHATALLIGGLVAAVVSVLVFCL